MEAVHLSSFVDLVGVSHLKEDHRNHHDSQEASDSSSSAFTPSSPSSSSSNSMLSPDLNPSMMLAIDILKNHENGGSTTHLEMNMSSSTPCYCPSGQKGQHRLSDSFSSMSSESLSMCTEGLGFESCDDTDDDWQAREDRTMIFTRKAQSENESPWGASKRSSSQGSFPPPISCMSRSGPPWVCYKSYRENGRFILKEIRIPNQEVLHSCCENGRLRLQFVTSDDEILEEGDEEKDKSIDEDDSDELELDTNGEGEGEGEEEGKGLQENLEQTSN